jgi:hypothetical protein
VKLVMPAITPEDLYFQDVRATHWEKREGSPLRWDCQPGAFPRGEVTLTTDEKLKYIVIKLAQSSSRRIDRVYDLVERRVV